MDWARAIERNLDALTVILASLFAMLGLQGSSTARRIPRAVHRAVLRVLRPAESAARRLIVIAARGLEVKPAAFRLMPKDRVIKRATGSRPPSFPLFDPRKRFDAPRHKGPRANPRILVLNDNLELVTLWSAREPKPKPLDDGCIDAARLGRRLEALKLALADLPRQAKRLARARMRRDKMPSLRLKSPMRPGRPPGYRKKPVHEVDEVLIECHALARDAMALDTS